MKNKVPIALQKEEDYYQEEAISHILSEIPRNNSLQSFMGNTMKLLEEYIKWKNSSTLRQQSKNIFANQSVIFKNFQAQQDYQFKQFLCAKMLQSAISSQQIKKHFVYHCKECGMEYNSILCEQCFDLSKHKGHTFQRTQIEGGCCDCGDDSKWKKEGFCQKHKYSDQPLKKMSQFDQKKTNQLTENFNTYYLYHLQALCVFYQKFNERKQKGENKNILKLILDKIDFYGAQLIKSLIDINKNRTAFNEMTISLFKNHIAVTKRFKFIPMEKETQKIPLKTTQIKLLLFSFIQLKETSRYISELFILLCYRHQQLRKQITVQFIKRYNEHSSFINSGYQQLAPQLLSNSEIIKGLIKQSHMIPLLMKIQNEEKVQQNQIHNTLEKLKLYYQDISYLVNMRLDSAKQYWQLFASYNKQCFFDNIAPHATIFQGNPEALKHINKYQYKIEHICLKKILQIAKLLGNQKGFQEKIITRLFTMITSESEKDQNDLFLTYERIWILFAFVYLTNDDKSTTINFSEIDDNKIKNFIQMLKIRIVIKEDRAVKKDDIIKKYFGTICKRLIHYWHKVCFIVRNGKAIQENEMFYRYYLKDDNLLFNLDSLLFKFIIKILAYYREKQTKQLTKQQSPSKNKIQSRSSYLNSQVSQIETIVNDQLQKIQIYLNDASSQDQRLDSVTFLLNFINMLSQVIYSDIPQLSLGTNFENIHQRSINRQRILQIYKNYYYLLTNKNITKRQFKELMDYLFVEETAVFNELCLQNKGDIMHLVLLPSDKKLMNLKYYQSQKYKLRNTSVINMLIPVNDYSNHPYSYKNTSPPGYEILKFNKIWEILEDWLFRCFLEYKHSAKYAYHLINEITEQYIKLSYLLKDLLKEEQIRKSYKKQKQQILGALTPSNRQRIQFILSYNYKSQMQSDWSQLKKSNISLATPEDKNVQNEKEPSLSGLSSAYQQNWSPHKSQILQRNTIDPKICNICRDDVEQNLKNSFLLYFVRWSNFHQVNGINKSQKFLVFTTCGHHFHEKCFQQAEFDKLQGKCPKCKLSYNFVMQVTWENQQAYLPYHENPLNNKLMFICLDQLKQIQDIMKIERCNIVKEMLRSIIGNSLYIFNLANKEIKDEFISTYICLWQRFRCLQDHQIDLQRLFIESPLKIQGQSKYYNRILDILFRQIVKKNEITFTYLFNNKILESLSDDINRKFDGIKKNEQYFKLIRLPENLKQLQQKEKQWSCSFCEQKGLTLYVCLIDRGNPSFKICQKCQKSEKCQKNKKNIIDYIKQEHLNECIFIRTDNGAIYYYALLNQGTKVKVSPYPSIYVNTVNKVGHIYSLGGYWPKEQYYLDREDLRRIEQEFFSLKKMSSI